LEFWDGEGAVFDWGVVMMERERKKKSGKDGLVIMVVEICIENANN
jgi:hypothetical protein